MDWPRLDWPVGHDQDAVGVQWFGLVWKFLATVGFGQSRFWSKSAIPVKH